MNKRIVNCVDCGYEFDEGNNGNNQVPCPKCASLKKQVQLFVSENVFLNIKECVGLKFKKQGQKRPSKELISGDEYFKKENRWISKERIIDRENDRYYEKAQDTETGFVLHECDEPLSEHTGHGSDKKNSNDRKSLYKINMDCQRD
ncbi:MAG TPA: hypothetical protein DEF34_08245 [Desulfotomaculum sp.]|nr:hypothetical protein [Desulfotomaculum sp.]